MILLFWAPTNPKARWHHLCSAIPDIRTYVTTNQIFSRPLNHDALDMIINPHGNIRLQGNIVAHQAGEDVVREAVEHAALGDIDVLKSIWQSVFDKDL